MVTEGGLRPSPLILVSLCCIVALWITYIVYTEQNFSGGGIQFDNNWLFPNDDETIKRLQSTEIKISKGSIAERFEKRNQYVKEVCEKIKGSMDIIRQSPRRLVYLKENRIVYCPIEKIASTFWKKILYTIGHLDEINDTFSVRPGQAMYGIGNKRLSKGDNVSDIFEGSISFLFVRDPFSRLVSGWTGKFFALNPMYWKMGKKIIFEERYNKSRKIPECGHDVSFKEFVSFFSKKILAGRQVNGHFSPSITHCNVCDMNFTYIGKYETFKEDTEFIVDKFQVDKKIDINSNFEKRSVYSMVNDHVRYIFATRAKWTECMSFQCGLYRSWKRLVCEGVISKKIDFPYTKVEQVKNLTEDEFVTAIIEAHERSDPKEISNNRNEVLKEAFLSLDKKTLDEMVQAFETDLDLFDYSREPDFLRQSDHVNSTLHYHLKQVSYLKDCPY